MEELQADLDAHFENQILKDASQLQCASATIDDLHDTISGISVYTVDQFGKELTQCIESLPAAKVILCSTCCSAVMYVPFLNRLLRSFVLM